MGKKKSQPVCKFSPNVLDTDPSFNSRQVVKAAIKRIDDIFKKHEKSNHDLRESDERLRNFRFKAVREREKINEKHSRELRKTETGRLDSIRQVDQVNAANTAVGLDGSLKTFAATAFTNAENLRNQLNSTATAMQKTTADLAVTLANQQAQRDETNNKRFTALEQSYAENKGKEAVADPIATQALINIQTLLSSRSENTGGKLAMREVIAYVLAAIAIGGFIGKYI